MTGEGRDAELDSKRHRNQTRQARKVTTDGKVQIYDCGSCGLVTKANPFPILTLANRRYFLYQLVDFLPLLNGNKCVFEVQFTSFHSACKLNGWENLVA